MLRHSWVGKMVNLPVIGPDPYDTFFCLHLAVLFAPFRDYVLIQLSIFILPCYDWLRHLLLRWCNPPF